MKCESYQQYAIVAADSAQELTKQLNATLRELRYKNPKVTFEGMIARISYTEHVHIIEDLSDEYESAGVKLTCQDCPCFEPVKKSDGTVDARAKKGRCPNALYGVTRRDSRACDTLFELINNGEVRLCLSD